MRADGMPASVPSRRKVQDPLVGSHSHKSLMANPVVMSQPPKTMALLMPPANAIE